MRNACDIPLDERAGSLPQLSGALSNWLQPMTFIKVDKGLAGGFLVESGDELQSWRVPNGKTVIGSQIDVSAFITPFKPTEMMIQAIGERSWQWFTIICLPNLWLVNDDCVIAGCLQYRVVKVNNYSKYGFMNYTTVQDYTFAGPLIPQEED